MAADRKKIASVLLGLISSVLACMQLNVALLNAEINYARGRLNICKLFTLSTAQNSRQKPFRRAGKQSRPRRFWVRPGRTSAWWDNLVNPQWIRGESEYVWTGEFDLNTLWSHNVWTRIFSYPERKSCGFKNIRIREDGALVKEWPTRYFVYSELAVDIANTLFHWYQQNAATTIQNLFDDLKDTVEEGKGIVNVLVATEQLESFAFKYAMVHFTENQSSIFSEENYGMSIYSVAISAWGI